ncbi:hypothetical protein HAX54_051585 [Datura stramonium]|uniref:Uncharacterized protein n=1 Tax=Datura stramonium TaxID=4076 RepID=A0ABS8WPZ0_DATST|nr:hypothetical protein [Datura stramonium]
MQGLLRGCAMRPMEVETRGPAARVVLVVLTPEVVLQSIEGGYSGQSSLGSQSSTQTKQGSHFGYSSRGFQYSLAGSSHQPYSDRGCLECVSLGSSLGTIPGSDRQASGSAGSGP